MAQDQAALDAALTALGTLATQLVAEVSALIAKVQSNPSGDFTNEVTALNSMAASFQTAINQAKPITGV